MAIRVVDVIASYPTLKVVLLKMSIIPCEYSVGRSNQVLQLGLEGLIVTGQSAMLTGGLTADRPLQ